MTISSGREGGWAMGAGAAACALLAACAPPSGHAPRKGVGTGTPSAFYAEGFDCMRTLEKVEVDMPALQRLGMLSARAAANEEAKISLLRHRWEAFVKLEGSRDGMIGIDVDSSLSQTRMNANDVETKFFAGKPSDADTRSRIALNQNRLEFCSEQITDLEAL